MFLSRLISSAFMLSVVILTIFVLPNWFFGLVAITMITMGIFEFYSMIEKKGIRPYKYFGTLMAIAIPLSIYQEFQLTKGWELLFITAACMAIFIMQLARRGSEQAVLSVSTTIFGILYVSWLFSFIVKLKLLPQGAALVAFLVFVTKASDMGAYALGSCWEGIR
jgi:phosphatidate cytidylyltransferase